MPHATHIYCACQPGAEAALKREVTVRTPDLRFAFSRPGFVTFKTPDTGVDLPHFVFARTQGWSLGRMEGETLTELSRAVWRQPDVVALLEEQGSVRLQVWQRDTALPGDDGFEPGPTPLTGEARKAIVAAAPAGSIGEQQTAVLDIAIVEPNQWWLGFHEGQSRASRWPGGVPVIELPDHAASRAYLKMREAIQWSALPAKRGDTWVELGCAPGGASQALLELGMNVIGVDPAEVDAELGEEMNFTHLRMRASDLPTSAIRTANWLAADINAAPSYTLDAAAEVVSRRGVAIRGMVLTLKLPSWDLATPELLLDYIKRVRSWGYRDVRLRQLAFNRREVCLVALKSRGQRRMRRGRMGRPRE